MDITLPLNLNIFPSFFGVSVHLKIVIIIKKYFLYHLLEI